MKRSLVTLVALWTLSGCYSATHRSESDGDADGDIDDEIAPCPEGVSCEAVGFDSGAEFDLLGEVVSVENDRAVFLGEDGIPVTYHTCGLSPIGLLAPGLVTIISHTHPEDRRDCWLSIVEGEGGPILVAAECDVEGDGNIDPPLAPIDWIPRLETTCEGARDQVCTQPREPVHLEIPERTFDLAITTETGQERLLEQGETAHLGEWQIRLLEARTTDEVRESSCLVEATGRSAVSVVRRSE